LNSQALGILPVIHLQANALFGSSTSPQVARHCEETLRSIVDVAISMLLAVQLTGHLSVFYRGRLVCVRSIAQAAGLLLFSLIKK